MRISLSLKRVKLEAIQDKCPEGNLKQTEVLTAHNETVEFVITRCGNGH